MVDPRSDTTVGFEAYVAGAYSGLMRFGSLLCGEVARGEDLVQTGLIQLFGAWDRLDDPAAAGAYVRRVMVREVGRWRRRRWTGERPTADLPDRAATRDATEQVTERVQLLSALRSLPVDQRAVLILRYLEQRSEREIADVLGIPPGTVKSRAARGLHALRTQGALDVVDRPEREADA